MTPTILSIQSWVCTGHVGNAAAVFPLQRLGAEVWPVHTVQFSNHPGHGAFAGRVFPGADTRVLVDGIAARGLLPRCDALLSGYMGDAGAGEAILHAASLLRRANPASLFCCDPVIGDEGPGVFVRPGIPELIGAAAVPAADILTPNGFELEHLTGSRCATIAEARRAAARLRARMRVEGPGIVLVTSLRTAETPGDCLDLLAGDRDADWLLRVRRLPRSFSGAGDLIAALFLLHVLRGCPVPAALEQAGSAVAGVLQRTEAAGADELLLIQAQDELVRPSTRLTSVPL